MDIRGVHTTTKETPTSVTSTVHAPKKPPVEPVELESTVRLYLSGIHSDLRDVLWYYRKKTGMMQEAGTYNQTIETFT